MGGEKTVRCDAMDRRSGKKQREEEVVVVVEKSIADARKVVVHGDLAAKPAPFQDPVEEPAGVDDIMLHIDGDDLIFSEDNFPSLPDFPCLSSPSSAANTVLSSRSSASSSTSSSSWSFLKVPEDASVANMQPPAAAAEVPSVVDDIMVLPPPPSLMLDHDQSIEFSDVGLDILGDIDLFDLSVDPWDTSSLFIHPEEVGLGVGDGVGDGGGDGVADLEARKMRHGVGDGCGGEGGVLQPQEESSSEEDLARIFLEWLRNNKDSISPEDLRSIKLKRATIESAARRLGRNKQGRSQLLKLILTWVQNYHLQRKRQLQQLVAPPPFPYENRQHRQCPVAPQLDYNYAAVAAAADSNIAPGCNSWMRYSVDPSAAAGASQHPALANAYGGDMVYPGAVAPPYPYYHGTSSVVVNSQPFSPTADFVDPAGGGAPWPSTQLASALAPQFLVPPPQYPGGGFATNQFLGHPVYHQGGGHRLAGVASATKEARKKRMARQRRLSSLHHHRNHNQQHSHHPAIGGAAEAMANGGVHPDATGWPFWANMTSSGPHMPDAHIPPNMKQAAAPPPVAQQQPSSRSQQQSSASASDKRQGWKGEKNLKFLLQKVLKQSDVGSLGRIVLPKKEAETHLPELDARDGISIPMEDIGTSQVWNMRYRFWPNNKSRMYLLENTGDFVRSNGLQEGDFIVIYSDVKCGKYMIRGVKVRQPVESSRPAAQAASSRNNSAAGSNINRAHQRRANGSEKAMSAAGAPKVD